MTDFINALFSQNFMQNIFFAGILASIACGVIGTFVVIKKISFFAGGIAHAVLGGIGIAYFFGFNETLLAIIFSLISGIIIGLVNFHAKESEDIIISSLWTLGMSLGIIFMHLTPGYNADLTTYLFGSFSLISTSDLIILSVLLLIIIITVFLFYRLFVAISFDSEYAELKKIKTKRIYMLLLCLISLTVVLLMRITGLILLIALLSLPAAISKMWAEKISIIMFFASILSFAFINLGLIFSYQYELPLGATIVVFLCISYFVSLLSKIFLKN